MERPPLKNILEAALMAAGSPLSLERMQSLFDDHEQPKSTELRQALTEIKQDLLGRGIELIEVASGYRLQVRTQVAPWVARLWEEKPQRYSRALLETLSLIAYRQPITRGDIEDVRGVVVSSQMMKTLIERDWVRIVGYRDVPGRPAMYATTKEFLDYFGLQSLEDLPSLAEIRELDDANRKLELGEDAQARQETPKEYDFSSEEEVEQRGASVLDATEDDLAKAAALVERVEANVFARPEDEQDGTEAPQDLGDLLKRLENAEQDREPPVQDAAEDDGVSGHAVVAQDTVVIDETVVTGETAVTEPVAALGAPESGAASVTEQMAVTDLDQERNHQDAPKTLEDAQRARLLAEQQAIKDRILAEIAAEQATAGNEGESFGAEPEAVDHVPDDDLPGMPPTAEQDADEQERLEQERLEAEALAEELLIQQEIEAEKALLAEQQEEQSDDDDDTSPSGPSLFG